MSAGPPLLSVRDLSVAVGTGSDRYHAVRGVSLDVAAGETVALVGESGCGKTLTALAVMGLLDGRVTAVSGGRILFEGTDILAIRGRERRRLLGARIAMVFQEPLTALNPVRTVGWQIAETIVLHRGANWSAAKARAVELLASVRISDPERRARQYPHEFSGGMRQRAVIAMALACEPVLIVADEPTTALDVTVQAQILALLRELQERTGIGLLLITHDLGVVAEMAGRVSVMYAGRVVESGPADAIFERPSHPYTTALLRTSNAISDAQKGAKPRLAAIRGTVPRRPDLITGCAFAPRCERAGPPCAAEPAMASLGRGHVAACVRVTEPV